MSHYERALQLAREAAVVVPEFETIATKSERDREVWEREGSEGRARARSWLLVGAAAWLTMPLIEAVEFASWQHASLGYSMILVPTLSLLWAARLSRDRRLRPAILTRAIAASNLILALLFSLVGIVASSVVSVVLAVATGRSLQLLGEHGLDGRDQPNSSFEPVKFRGVLILALIMASADALTLLWQASTLLFEQVLPYVGLTLAAAAIMVINVWGLLRLRTWALLSNMIANVVIAALALSWMLGIGRWVAFALATTAVIQLLLPLPILMAALGLGTVGQHERVGRVLLRGVVPAMVLATIVAAITRVLLLVL
jgi:hypothetical protein